MKNLEIVDIKRFNLTHDFVPLFNRDCKSGNKHPNVVVPPVVISHEYLEHIINDSIFIIDNIFKIPQRIFGGDHKKLAKILKISDINIDLINSYLNDYWIEYIKKFIRPDIIIKNDGYKFVEFNITAAIAGAGICDMHMERFLRSISATSLHLREEKLRTEPLALKWIKTLIDTLLATKIRVSTFPIFCSAVFASDVSLEEDFTLKDFRDLLGRYGFRYIIAPITELNITDRGVYYQDEEIDIIFTDFTYSQYLERHNDLSLMLQFIKAHEKGLVMFASPPGSMLFDNKAILAFLTDERYRQFYSEYEFNRLKKLIAHTRILERTMFNNIIAKQNQMVIKPGFDFGGNNVYIGRNFDSSSWRKIFDDCINDQRLWVVQDFVNNQLLINDPNLDTKNHCCLGPVFYQKEYAGTYYRDIRYHHYKGAIINSITGARYSSVFVKEVEC